MMKISLTKCIHFLAIDIAVGRYGAEVTDTMISAVQCGKCDNYDPDELSSLFDARSSITIQNETGILYSFDVLMCAQQQF
jgi:hypothetical protein